MTHVIASGYMNPVTPGHIEYFRLAKELGDVLWVIVNNDKQAELKRGVPSFQDEDFRLAIVNAIRFVNETVLSIDLDASVCQSIRYIYNAISPDKDTKIIFAKGGDRMADEIPERKICEKLSIQIIDSLGAKTHSSSDYALK